MSKRSKKPRSTPKPDKQKERLILLIKNLIGIVNQNAAYLQTNIVVTRLLVQKVGLSESEIVTAVEAENARRVAGQSGGPSPAGTTVDNTGQSESQLSGGTSDRNAQRGTDQQSNGVEHQNQNSGNAVDTSQNLN